MVAPPPMQLPAMAPATMPADALRPLSEKPSADLIFLADQMPAPMIRLMVATIMTICISVTDITVLLIL